MSDQDKFRHDRSHYERPRTPFQCGRGGMWSKPCWQGPQPNGLCGGESDCNPVHKGDRWECRRPKHAGGPCTEGPRPDGNCAHVRPACAPRPTIRRWRGRLSLAAFGLVLALIGATAHFDASNSAGFSSLDPGPLSSVHDNFTQNQGCGACHVAHEQDGLAWFTSAFLSQDNTGRCLQCHSFRPPERSAHNTSFADRDDLPEVECQACHSEHRGADFSPAMVASAVCGNCHQSTFESFSNGHPGFDTRFPYQIPNSINFDHNKHIGDYFVKERWTTSKTRDSEFAKRAAKSCVACHVVEAATREVKPRPYEEVCGRCHEDQILERPLIVFSPYEVYPLAAMVFGLDEDADDIDDQLLQTATVFSEESLDFLAAQLDELERGDSADKLLAGLNTEVVQSAALAWVDEEDYEPDYLPDVEVAGWRAGEDPHGGQSLHYRPAGHTDPLVRSWLELALAIESDEDADTEFSDYALEHLLDDSEGPGACGKCHAAGISSSVLTEGSPTQWTFRGSINRPHTRFSHAPHINLLGPDNSCKTCHVLNKDADYADYFEDAEREAENYQSNFHAIDKQTCDRCHKPTAVQADCLLCHQYHRDASFKLNFQQEHTANQ